MHKTKITAVLSRWPTLSSVERERKENFKEKVVVIATVALLLNSLSRSFPSSEQEKSIKVDYFLFIKLPSAKFSVCGRVPTTKNGAAMSPLVSQLSAQGPGLKKQKC